MGDSKHETKQQNILNRVVTWYDRSIEYEADPRHAETVLKYDNEGESSTTPGCKSANDRERFPELSPSQSTQHRVATVRCNFLAIGRPDIKYSAKEASKYMSSPRECDWSMVYKLARYLRHKPSF